VSQAHKDNETASAASQPETTPAPEAAAPEAAPPGQTVHALHARARRALLRFRIFGFLGVLGVLLATATPFVIYYLLHPPPWSGNDPYAHWRTWLYMHHSRWVLVMFPPCLFVALMGGLAWHYATSFRQTTAAIASAGGSERVGPLIEALEVGTISSATDDNAERARAEVMNALTQILPQLSEAGQAQIDSRHRSILCRQLLRAKPARDTDFIVAALAVLKDIGDARTIQTARKLNDLAGATREAARIREAASECLYQIQRRTAGINMR
jgi:hypothetical protein